MGELTQENVNAAMELGLEAGRAAATWFGQPDTDWAAVRSMLDDGDPELFDGVNLPNLSGEWADGQTPRTLCEDLDLDPDALDEWDIGTLCSAWEEAVSDGYWQEVERQAAHHLA